MILRQRLKPRVDLDLTPLIDVVFQLVIFFMISSVFNTAPGIELNLPDSTTSEAVEVTEVRITVAGADELYLNRDLVALSSLGDTLRDWKDQGRLEDGAAVLVEGGRTVPYETIITVLDEVRRGGVDAVNLITAPITDEP
ncbi:MAG: biopolymer transporter ExbD [Spirochaetes bacterium]|nr:MAG: biopolymer transporter ExbD [Spirochaetota bacterium]RKX89962.1 MAG: biopolymer transporter ExbD [Spirochaetota bacterium]RKX98569.1 MAG: biopolymer transporter ExbD [Spirochaetota bacterium]